MPIGTAGFIALGTAGASLLGGMKQNSANETQARQARDWSAYMRSTAYQATTEDMMKAGLNPMLAYSQGASGTPSAAMAQMQNTLGPAAQAGSAAYNEITSAQLKNVQSDHAREQVINMAADTGVKEATAENIQADTRLKMVAGPRMMAEIRSINASTEYTKAQKDLALRLIENAVRTGQQIDADTGNKRLDAVLKGLEIPEAFQRSKAMSGTLGEIKPYVDVGGKVLNSASGLVRSLK